MSSLDDYQFCPRRWRTEESGRGHEHSCFVMFRRGGHHDCRCCCGAIDLAQWDLPASKTPSLMRRADRRPKPGEPEARHGYTPHGHPCCGQAPIGGRPPRVHRCGGIRMCGNCQWEASVIHDAPPPDPAARLGEPTEGDPA